MLMDTCDSYVQLILGGPLRVPPGVAEKLLLEGGLSGVEAHLGAGFSGDRRPLIGLRRALQLSGNKKSNQRSQHLHAEGSFKAWVKGFLRL